MQIGNIQLHMGPHTPGAARRAKELLTDERPTFHRPVADGSPAGDVEKGKRVARLIWDDAPGLDELNDPRTGDFASAVIDGLSAALADSPGAIRKMMRSASHAAEDLNVGQFQGFVEVIQNADDVRANEVRFMLRNNDGESQLLVVHDGQPVACQHVLGMALPFITTKTHRIDQRGRFGIGLKTLRRIASTVAVHSEPYHFSGDQLSLARVEPEPGLPGFYDPAADTLLVLNLHENFVEEELRNWFEEWEEDGLIFLGSVRRFRWCEAKGPPRFDRSVDKSPWKSAPFDPLRQRGPAIRDRRVRGRNREWRVWNATVSVPAHLKPAHKAKSEYTEISVAVPDQPSQGSLYVGFKTRVSVTLNLSFDAQFDPSTARDQLIQNDWNNWLIDRCADLLADIAAGLLVHGPKTGWTLVPLQREKVGDETDGWLRDRFGAALELVRKRVGSTGLIPVGHGRLPLSDLAYEAESLSGLLTPADLKALVQGSHAVPTDVRDDAGRWREVLDELAVATRVDTPELLDGFARGLFARKDAEWWVEAAFRLTANHSAEDELFGVPYWLTDDRRSVPCQRKADTARPLVAGQAVSGFSARWKLLDRIHEAYSRSTSGKLAIEWLEYHAGFTRQVDAGTELAAFAERFAEEPLSIGDEELRQIRDRFDQLSDRNAQEIGHRVGAALLLDGHVYHHGKRQMRKVSPLNAYLSRTLDRDNPDWPTAAGTTPDIEWVAARYSDQLKTGATRRSRRRADGTISRGPRKFLMLLGVDCAPRLVRTGTVRGGHPTRVKELQSAGAEEVTYDFESPDLAKVLAALKKLKTKEAKTRSPALFRALARNWQRVYSEKQEVPSLHHARVYSYDKAPVTADWLIDLREEPWIAVGRGRLVPPASAVVKTADTRTLYPTSAFAVELEPKTVRNEFADAIGLVTDIRLSDLVEHLARIRDGEEPVDNAQVLQVYRNIARICPSSAAWNTRIGDMTVQQLRARSSEGAGLIHIGDGVWHRPADLLRGRDIFHDPARFAPGGPAYAKLWSVLDVREPSLTDCIASCRALVSEPYTTSTVAILIDVFRYMEPLLPAASRSNKNRLKKLPLFCSEGWEHERPVYFVRVPELRSALANSLPGHRFWTPACDVRDLPNLVEMTQVTNLRPALRVVDDTVRAREQGEAMRSRFVQAVEHLSDAMARNDPATREKIMIGWDQLKTIPLFIYDRPMSVQARDQALSAKPVLIEQQALLTDDPAQLHVWVDALPKREFGGRAIGSLFPADVSRNIEAEWCVSWLESMDVKSEAIRLASDEALKQALEEQAQKINAAPKGKIKVSTPRSRTPGRKPRTLKESVGTPAPAEIIPGGPPKPVKVRGPQPLSTTPPPPSPPSSTPSSAFVAYTNADLEQRGWEILEQVLNTSENDQLVDLRKRHGVGADGAINWKTFVEMKATGLGPQSSVEMSNSEYDRAKERGSDFILALVSGLEVGQTDEVRLIIDPANYASTRPVNGIRLVGLLDAPAIVVPFGPPPVVDS